VATFSVASFPPLRGEKIDKFDLILRKVGFSAGARGSAVVEARCYNPMLQCIFFSIYLILPVALGPGVYSASNK
jgi:hypothetical protein